MDPVTPFIGQLFVMVRENQDCMQWSSNRKAVVVGDVAQLPDILVRYCSKSKKVRSFVRQLHLHGFKVKQGNAQLTFQHQLFDSSGKYLADITTKATYSKARIDELETQVLRKSDAITQLMQDKDELIIENERLVQENNRLSRELAMLARPID